MLKTEQIIKEKYCKMLPYLNERSKRIWAATEAESYGWGGISVVNQATGISRVTITEGLKELELNNQSKLPSGMIRKHGGGRKKISEKDKSLDKDLKKSVEGNTRGDPESLLLWTCKSLRNLATELSKKGHNLGYVTVGLILKEKGYTLQTNKKTKEGMANHPDRDTQFKYINDTAKDNIEAGNPVLSVDTKKKELIGNYKNNGKTWLPKGKPIEVNGHDFPDKINGKAVPYGIYDIHNNQGYVNVGIDHDTAEFAVGSIRRWWNNFGKTKYANSKNIMITADCGGSNGYRTRLWKKTLQEFADEIKKDIVVCHFPPGTSKWNKIEHKLFSFISINWKGRPLTSYQTIINLIASTKTATGLKIYAELDENKYELNKKVTDEEMRQLNIKKHEFHGEWNYTIKSRQFFV